MISFYKAAAPHKVFIEACDMSHYWTRTLSDMGHNVCIIQEEGVKMLYFENDETDVNDAEEICIIEQNHINNSLRSILTNSSATVIRCPIKNCSLRH
jgi:hypothetical protein